MSVIKNASVTVDGNATAAEQLSNELAALSAAGKCFTIRYSRDMGRYVAHAVQKEERMLFLSRDKNGKETKAFRAFGSAFTRDFGRLASEA